MRLPCWFKMSLGCSKTFQNTLRIDLYTLGTELTSTNIRELPLSQLIELPCITIEPQILKSCSPSPLDTFPPFLPSFLPSFIPSFIQPFRTMLFQSIFKIEAHDLQLQQISKLRKTHAGKCSISVWLVMKRWLIPWDGMLLRLFRFSRNNVFTDHLMQFQCVQVYVYIFHFSDKSVLLWKFAQWMMCSSWWPKFWIWQIPGFFHAWRNALLSGGSLVAPNQGLHVSCWIHSALFGLIDFPMLRISEFHRKAIRI